MADTADVLRVGRVSAGPVVHPDLLGAVSDAVLGLPEGVHEDVDGALGGDLGIAVKYRHPQHHRRAATFLLLLLERRQRRPLPLQLRTPVRVGRRRLRVRRVRRLARSPREHVVRADVDQHRAARRAE